MLELYNGLKRKISEHLNEKIINNNYNTSGAGGGGGDKEKTLKEKYLENHISKLEFTEIISRFGVLGTMEENGSSLKINVKKLPKLDLLNRLANFTIEQVGKLKHNTKSPPDNSPPSLSVVGGIDMNQIFIPIHTLLSSIKSMDQWEKKGIELPTTLNEKITIYPHFGVYMPTRKELFSSLIKQTVEECILKIVFQENRLAPLGEGKLKILDLGAGSGVFSIYVSKLLSERGVLQDLEIKFVDINTWALDCSKFNFENCYLNNSTNEKTTTNRMNEMNSLTTVCGKYVHLDLTCHKEEVGVELQHSEISSFLTSQNSINLILCNPPWISIEKQDYEHIQRERMKFGSFKNTIDLSIFDTDHEFLDQFLNLLESSQSKQTYGLLLVSNIGHLVGVERIPILKALEEKLQQRGNNIKIEQVFTLRRDSNQQQGTTSSTMPILPVKNFLVNNPLASKRKKTPHQDVIQETKSNEEVYCVVFGKIIN